MSPLGPQWAGLHRSLHKQGGFSVNQQGRGPTTGYMVSDFLGEEKSPLLDTGPEHLADYSLRHAKALSEPGKHHGAWVEDEHVYQDVSRRYPPDQHGKAYSALVANVQHSMYDLEGKKSEQETMNPAYEGGLHQSLDRTRRLNRSVSRMSGANVPGIGESSPHVERSQAWFASAVPASVEGSRRRGAGLLRGLLQGPSERAS